MGFLPDDCDRCFMTRYCHEVCTTVIIYVDDQTITIKRSHQINALITALEQNMISSQSPHEKVTPT